MKIKMVKLFVSMPFLFFLIIGCAGIESKGMFSFERSLNIKSYGYSRVSPPHPVRAGKTSERFEVRPGDCYWNFGGWDDCSTDRERSELSEQEPYSSVGSEYWYGWSVFIPEDYPNISPTGTALGQFHQKGNGRTPPVMFIHGEEGYSLRFIQIYDYEKYLLIPEEELREQWHDILVNAKWSKGEDGFIKVWVNGVQKVDYTGPSTYYSDPIYFKYGIYRSFISKYKNKYGVNEVPTQVVYFDEVRKGRSREYVDPNLRE